jgi:hypothetical protein
MIRFLSLPSRQPMPSFDALSAFIFRCHAAISRAAVSVAARRAPPAASRFRLPPPPAAAKVMPLNTSRHGTIRSPLLCRHIAAPAILPPKFRRRHFRHERLRGSVTSLSFALLLPFPSFSSLSSPIFSLRSDGQRDLLLPRGARHRQRYAC